MDCEIITFEVERKVIFACAWQGHQTLTTHDAKFSELCNFELLHHHNAHHIRYLCAKS
jgi:hypothetical protein